MAIDLGPGPSPCSGNHPPVADAGPDQPAQVNDTVTLDGSGSNDADGDELTFVWTLSSQPAGSTATLTNPTGIFPTILIDEPGDYVIELIVNDGADDSAPDTVMISTNNVPPVAHAGLDQTILVSQQAFLDGTGSTDANGDALTYTWTLTTQPTGSTTTLDDPNSATPSFTVDQAGAYTIVLVVSDGLLSSEADVVIIATDNSAPVANAGPDHQVRAGTTVTLDGTNSSDVDGDPLTYQWDQTVSPAGSTAALSDPTVADPTLTPDVDGDYVAQLQVNDGTATSAPDTALIRVGNTKPMADAGPDQLVPLNTTVQLDGSHSHDPQGDPLTYQWTLTGPVGSTATLSDPTTNQPTFDPDLAGTYTATLIVNDGDLDSDPDDVQIIVDGTNLAPTARAGPDQSSVTGVTIFLNGAGSSDPENGPLTYQWTMLQQPVGSTATLSNSTVVNPHFIPDVDGVYVMQLIVHDGVYSSTPDSVTVIIGNTPPTLNPIGNQTVLLGQSLTFTVSGADPDGTPTRMDVLPLPLPPNLVFDATTGVVTFTPDASQVGDHVLTFAISDAFTTVTETITITVQAPAPGSVTALTGRILDTNDYVNGGIETPIVGATVSLLGPGISVVSDSQGFFTLSGVPAGAQVLDIDASTANLAPDGSSYASFRERIQLIANATKVIDRPFFLPRNDPNSVMTVNGGTVTAVNPNETTIVTNPTIGATLTIPPHTAMLNGLEYTGAITISEVPGGLAPAALPSTLNPALLVTIQPPGVVFTQPLKLNLANREGLPTNNDMNLWSLDPNAGAFEIVGQGSIFTNTINTVSGGVRAADWHFFGPPAPPLGGGSGNGGGGDQGPNQDSDEEKKDGCNSEIALCTGGLTETHRTVPYQTLGVNRSVQLVYSSRTAHPHVVIEEETSIPVESAVPNMTSVELTVGVPQLDIHRSLLLPTVEGFMSGGTKIGRPIFTDTSGFAEADTTEFRQKYSWAVPELPTGRYPSLVTLTNHYDQSSFGAMIYETLLINNQRNSPIGAGWTIDGVDRLHVQANGDVIMAKGNGGTQLYQKAQPGTLNLDQRLDLFSITSNPQKVIVADFTNDGVDDLGIPATFGVSGRFEIQEGLGGGNFQFLASSIVGNQIGHARAADFDGDGNLDVVASSTYIPGQVTVAYGDGAGNMIDPIVFERAGEYPISLEVGDFNNDGLPDVATGYSVANVIVIRLGTGIRGAGAFGADIVAMTAGGSPRDLTAADVDQDGNLDILSAQGGSLQYLKGDGTGALAAPEIFALDNSATHLLVTDFTGDGYPDLALPEDEFLGGGGGDRVYIFENTGLGSFWGPVAYPLPLGVDPESITSGDLNGDGNMDLMIGGGGGIVVLLRGDGFGAFGTPVVTTVGFAAQGLTLTDIEGNGTLDVVASLNPTSTEDHIALLLNPDPTQGSFISPPGEYSTLTLNGDSTYTQREKTGTLIDFDADGKQTSITDRNGNTTTYAYDAQGNLTTITDPVGLVTTLAYAGGVLDTITDHVGRITRLEHDGAGNVTTIIDPDLSERAFTYDTDHQMTSQVNKRNFRTQYLFNEFGHVVQTLRPDESTNGFTPERAVGLVDPAGTDGTKSQPLPPVLNADAVATKVDGNGQATTMALDTFGAVTQVTDPLGRTTTTERNGDGLPTRILTPNGAEAELTYDEQGNLLSRREAKGAFGQDRTTKFEYDPTFHLLTKITDPYFRITTIQRDANGNPEVITNTLNGTRVRTFRTDGLVETDTDENGELTTFTYDAVSGNLATIVDAEGHTTRFVRDTAGNVTSLVEGDGTPDQRTRTFTYDTMNRLTSATDGTANPPTQFRYDGQGNLEETERPTGEIEARTYDPLNRVASIDDPLRGLTTFTYDANGNLIRTVNALGDPTTFAYDAANQLLTITDALNGVQAFAYDVEGNVETFTDARNKVTTFAYDLLNRQTTRITHGGTFTTTFTYDKRDSLKNTTDPKNQTIMRNYDHLNRLTSITTPDNTITIAYDAVSNPTSVTDNDSEVVFTYDGLNRVQTAETSPGSGIQPNVLLTSMYDAVGNRTQLDEDSGTSVTNYLYDLAGRLTTLTPPAGAALNVNFAYDPTGRLSTITYPNGVVSAYGYDARGRLDSLSHTLGANPSFASFGYTYNPVGNILAILDQVNPSENRTHSYDALQRLTTGGTVANAESYAYDLVGNRTTSSVSSTHTHDDLNRLLEDDQFTYTYDDNGNLETKTDKGTSAVTTYHWDAQDQLIQIDRPDSTTVTYKYDGLGRRIEKDVAGSITRYVYDGDDILLEFDGTNTFVARYSHGQQVDQPLVLQKAGIGYLYYHHNHQGSISHLTDNSGTVVNSYVYDSYGRRISVIESVMQPYSYTGREYDVESGLYYYRARYYDANLGRFFSEDPIGFNGKDQNLYRYVLNNPVNFTDPDGEIIVPLIVGAVVTAAILASAAFFIKPCMEGCQNIKENEPSSKPKVPDNLPPGNPNCPKDNPSPPQNDFDPMEPRKFKLSFADCLKKCLFGVQALAGAGDPAGTVGSMAGQAAGEAIGGGTIEVNP